MAHPKVFFMPHPPVIISEIGRGNELEAKDTILSMEKLGKLAGKWKPDTILFITPHGNSFHNGTCILDSPSIKGDFSLFGLPSIGFQKRVNQKLSREIFHAFDREDFTALLLDEEGAKAYGAEIKLDNGVMVPMYFIDQYFSDYDIVHITPGFTSFKENYLLGKILQDLMESNHQNYLMVCSGDLSHALKEQGPYEFHPSGPAFDEMVQQAFVEKHPLPLITLKEDFVEEAAQCGLRSFLLGFGLMDGYSYDMELLSYEGPFGVGYLTGWMSAGEERRATLVPCLQSFQEQEYQDRIDKEDDYIKLARKSMEEYVRNKCLFFIDRHQHEFSREFIESGKKRKAGVFVSIHKQGELRGCIGTIEPVQGCLLEEIIHNSISACSMDPRFYPVASDELKELDIKVDILSPPEAIDTMDELDIKKYGLIVKKGSKRGLLLPNIEGIHSIDQQIAIAMDKAGIQHRVGMRMYRFEVTRHEKEA